MFLGHFGVGLAAKRAEPRMSLGTLFLASQWLDLLWPSLLLLGLESVRIDPAATKLTPLEFTHYPISHSLAAVLAWAAAFGAVVYAVRRTARGALLCAALVASHWFLDALTHKPDLPLLPGSAGRVGLGLWNHPVPAVTIETAVFVVGVILFLRAGRALDRIGRWGLGALLAFLCLTHLGNLLGPPPPSVAAVAWVGQAQWLLVAWAYWVDRHRALRGITDEPQP